MSLLTLETIVVEIEALLNDHPLTYVSSELMDPDPLLLTYYTEESPVFHMNQWGLMNSLILRLEMPIDCVRELMWKQPY